MKPDEILEALARVGERRHAARRAHLEASREIVDLAKRARRAGVPKLRIARAARVSRTALDEWLGDR